MFEDAINLQLHTFHSERFKGVVDEAIGFFSKTPILKLPPPDRFTGSGVYAIYYTGAYSRYQKIALINQGKPILPIYVGKAVPPGWRTARSKNSETLELYNRLCEHARSIKQISLLQLKDFLCCFMILSNIEGDLIVPVEAEMIRKYKPLWNTVIDGFGNHDPGSGRYAQAKSEWDILHPGRTWAKQLTGKSPQLKNIVRKIQLYESSLLLP